MSRYSAVVVARDHPRLLLATLLHLRQHAQPSEVILIDNASTVNLSGALALSQIPVRHLRMEEHQSLGAAANAGLDAAENDIILLLQGDVLVQCSPEDAVGHLVERPDIG